MIPPRGRIYDFGSILIGSPITITGKIAFCLLFSGFTSSRLPMQSHHKLIFDQTQLFMGLDEQTLEKIAEHTEIKSFTKGKHLFYQNDVAHSFYVVIDGWVSVSRSSPEGTQTILHVFKSGESFAEAAALSFGIYPASALAESNCTVLEVNIDSFKKILMNNPDLVLNIINNLSRRLLDITNELEKLHTRNAPLRLAEFILDLCPEKNGAVLITLPFSKHCLAARLKLKPESLSRAFASLKPQGVVTDRGAKITVENIGKLQLFVDG